jgi:hypothetical protein
MSREPSPRPDPAAFAANVCPDSVSFATDIKPLFTGEDWGCMHTYSSEDDWNPVMDLRDYESVKAWAADISSAVAGGRMPKDPAEGRWSQEKVNLFQCWIKLGCAP